MASPQSTTAPGARSAGMDTAGPRGVRSCRWWWLGAYLVGAPPASFPSSRHRRRGAGAGALSARRTVAAKSRPVGEHNLRRAKRVGHGGRSVRWRYRRAVRRSRHGPGGASSRTSKLPLAVRSSALTGRLTAAATWWIFISHPAPRRDLAPVRAGPTYKWTAASSFAVANRTPAVSRIGGLSLSDASGLAARCQRLRCGLALTSRGYG